MKHSLSSATFLFLLHFLVMGCAPRGTVISSVENYQPGISNSLASDDDSQFEEAPAAPAIFQTVGDSGNVQPARELKRSEQRRVQELVEAKWNGHFGTEAERLTDEYQPQIDAVEEQKEQQLASAGNRLEREIIEETAEEEIAAIRRRWEANARQEAAERYGNAYAIPLEADQDRALIALASIQEDGTPIIQPTAFALGQSPSSVGRVSFDRVDYAIIGEESAQTP